MRKDQINQLIEEKHLDLFNWIEKQPVEKWIEGPKEKWTTGQQIVHLVDSIKKLNQAMSLPKFLLKLKFGKSNRETRNYDQIIKKYQDKLVKYKEEAKQFNAHITKPSLREKTKLLAKLQIQQKKLQHKTNQWKDSDLDSVILPHPLMGKMPVREIIMWTAYHTEHHTKDLIENY